MELNKINEDLEKSMTIFYKSNSFLIRLLSKLCEMGLKQESNI